MIFHDREDLLQGEGGDYEAVLCRLEQQDTEWWTVGVEGGQTPLYEPCIFCSPVFSVRKRTFLRIAGEVFLSQKIFLSLMAEIFFSHRTHRFNRTFLRTISSPWGGGPSPNPSPAGRGVICEVTPIRLLTYFVKVFSLTERTEFTEPFGAHFELTEGLRHTENTERFSYRRYR